MKKYLVTLAILTISLVARAGDIPRMVGSPTTGPVTMDQAKADGFRPLDIRSIVTMGWKDDRKLNPQGGWTCQGENDMRSVQPGLQKLLGIPFDLIDPAQNNGKAVLTLKSAKFPTGKASAVVDVNDKAASVYFLHASAWTGGEMATYTVTYDDDSKVGIPIRAGEEISDWWNPVNGKSFRVAWHSTNPQHDDVCAFAFGWDNPNPDKKIKNIEFKSAGKDGIVILCGVTLSAKPIALPDPKDIPTPEYLTSDVSTLDKSQWFEVSSKTDTFEPTCIDQTPNLDAPAGKHGFQKVENGKFVFEDKTPCRMVAIMGNPPKTKAEATATAKFMAKYGFTMLRMGHFVTGPEGANESIIDWTKDDTQQFNAEYMDRLDFFIAELAKVGIYTRFSTFWYRKMKAGDKIEGFDEAIAYIRKRAKTPPDPKKPDLLDTVGIMFFHPRVIQLNIELQKALMTHKNPYRDNKAYGEDPAICQIEVTNEDGVFFATFDGMAPVFSKMLTQLWVEWLKKKYKNQAGLEAAWGEELGGNESLEEGNIGRLNIVSIGEKLASAKPHRVHDQLMFLTELQNNYFNKFKDALREAGVKQPICGSGWFGGPGTLFTDIYANVKGMDYIDRHHYWAGGPGGWQILEMGFDPQCALTKPELFLKLGGERVIGMPYTISEWANVLPNQFRLEAPPLMAFYGNELNGWDAPIHFAWGGGAGMIPHMKWMWPINEPSTICQYPALSNMIRHADLKEGPDVSIRNLSDAKVFSGIPPKDTAISLSISGPYEALAQSMGINPRSLAATYATAVGRTGIAFTGAEEKPDLAVDLNKYLDMEKQQIRSATGELFWDYGAGYFTANAPRMQAAVGFMTNREIKLADCQIKTSNMIASIIVSPLDNLSIKESKHILITAVGRTRNVDMEYSRNGCRVIKRGEKGPIMHEGIKGTVTLFRDGKATVTALSPLGYKTVEVTPTVQNGQITIPMDGANKATYYEVKFE